MISRGDFFGGVTAAVVALPLALAFGVASGAGAAAGLYGAIAVGFFAALFGGTPSQVSGPTGPMTVVMAVILTETIALDPDQGLAIAFTVVSMAGILQIIAGQLRLGRYFVMVPFPVVSGFMTGIGVIIISLQMAPLLGVASQSNPLEALAALPEAFRSLSIPAFILGGSTLAALFLWPKRFQVLPPPLMALIGLSALSLGADFSEVPRIGEIPRGLPSIIWPQISLEYFPQMLGSACLLAALGAIDSLLTSLVADNLTRTQHDSDRELRGQGLGNIVAGLIGGLPGAGATMRTLVNIRLGGRTRVSGMLHSVVLATLMLGAAPLGEQIPLAVLAGILLKVGLDIIDWRFLRRLHKTPPFSAGLMILVLCVTVFVDLITAVAIGVFIANLETLYRFSEHQLTTMSIGRSAQDIPNLSADEEALLADANQRVLLYKLNGFMSYGLSRGIARRFSSVSDYQVLIVDFTEVAHVDLSAGLTLSEMIDDAKERGRRVLLAGLSEPLLRSLAHVGVLDEVPEADRQFDRHGALVFALGLITATESVLQPV